ncbi:MAG: hypothetical protein ACXWDO_11570 [Bacteroidia bacterium]
MKKVLFTSAMALILSLGAISCKKNYNCECVTKDSNGNVLGTTNDVINDTKKNAESQCETQQNSTNGATVTCEIK